MLTGSGRSLSRQHPSPSPSPGIVIRQLPPDAAVARRAAVKDAHGRRRHPGQQHRTGREEISRENRQRVLRLQVAMEARGGVRHPGNAEAADGREARVGHRALLHAIDQLGRIDADADGAAVRAVALNLVLLAGREGVDCVVDRGAATLADAGGKRVFGGESSGSESEGGRVVSVSGVDPWVWDGG